ncbi:MAG: hypothetical protein Q8S02_12595 [Hydrogenophaga sp.]|nr:hypothetical protein [Hydrogenophaga sp.]
MNRPKYHAQAGVHQSVAFCLWVAILFFVTVSGAQAESKATTNHGRNDYTSRFTNGLAFHLSQPLEIKEGNLCKQTTQRYRQQSMSISVTGYRTWEPDCTTIEGKMTVVDKNFKEVLPPVCETTWNNLTEQANSAGTYQLVACRSNKLWGVLNLKQEWLFPAEYSSISFTSEPTYDSKTWEENTINSYRTGKPKNKIGTARKALSENYFFKTMVVNDIILSNGTLTLVPHAKYIEPQFNNPYAYPVIVATNYLFNGISNIDPDNIWAPLIGKYPFHLIGLIAGISIAVLARFYFKSKGWNTLQIALAAPATGIVGGAATGLAAYVLFWAAVALFAVAIAGAVMTALARR